MLDSLNLWDLIEQRAAETPEKEMAVDESGRRMTFAEYRDRCLHAAAGLHEQEDVGEGTRVSWQLPTWFESMVLVGALARLQAVQNPILHIYREREVGFIMQQAEPALFLVPSTWRDFDFEAMAESLTGNLDTEVLVCDRELPEGDPSNLPAAPPVPDSPDDLPLRWLFYTSGTTSDPKGAKHTDNAIRVAARGMIDGLDLRDDDRSALVFPFTHIGGIVWLWANLATGLTVILDEAFDPAGTVRLLREESVTQAGSGTVFHQVYLKSQEALPDGEVLFPEVRAYPGGGAPKPPQLHYALKEQIGGAGIVAGYGLTEAPILTMASVEDPDEVLANTEGSAVEGVTLRIVDLDGNEVGPGEVGEVRAKGPQVTGGYLDPSLDEDAFDGQGWFRTGDLGHLDESGNLTITGRIKDVIIRKGETISAKEIEDVLYGHDKVADVAVVGLPDEERGEMACAVVVAGDDEGLTFEEMRAFLEGQGLMTRKIPERLEHVEALPRNPAGKVLKYELRDRFASTSG